ncbi:MAG: hypothetical protein OXC80_09575 [Gammaproteobacteria bacterium]|nr:hypothetical protein [Gammaproteobacteria bacterium]
MYKSVTYRSTLIFYDSPEVIQTEDHFGDPYIGCVVEPDKTAFRFLVVRVHKDIPTKLRCGEIDLLTMVENYSPYGWYLCETNDLHKPITLEEQDDDIPEDFLPNPDVYVRKPGTKFDQLVKEAVDRNRVVIRLKIESELHPFTHQLKWRDYEDISSRLRRLIISAGKHITGTLGNNEKSQLDLDILVPAQEGSVEILVAASNENQDLFEPNRLLLDALTQVDSTLDHSHKIDDLRGLAQQYSVEYANLYIDLLKALVRSESDLVCSWADPKIKVKKGSNVHLHNAKKLIYDVKSHPNEILNEAQCRVRGEFVQFKSSTGRWGLQTENGLVVGKVDTAKLPGKLRGLEVGKKYSFDCVKRQTFKGSLAGHEPQYFLREYDPV